MPPKPAPGGLFDSARLRALREIGLLDAPAQPAFDRLTRLVRQHLAVPVSLVSFVETERQFLLSAPGLPEPWATLRETPLSHSFCQHVVTTGEILQIDNAREHDLVRDNRAVEELGVTAYLGAPLCTSQGHVLGALCAIDQQHRIWTAADREFLEDLAALATTEFTLRELANELDARVRDEAAARVAAQEKLAQSRRLEVLGQLAGGIAHDFANVLQAVQAGIRIASRNLESDPAKASRVLETVGEAARRGGSITRRLLGFARRGQLRMETVALDTVLADLREVLMHTLNLPGLQITLEIAEGLPPVRTDRGELETVLVNLATNARDAMPAGGRLTLAAALDRVDAAHPTGLAAGSYVRFSAVDTGTGMSPETLARAAEPFFTTKEGTGTGLGLAMARDFAAQAGGAFAIESEPGQGTVVTIWLPGVGETAAD